MKRVSIGELRANLADVIGTVRYTSELVVIARKGKVMAVLISPEQYEGYQREALERFGEIVDAWRQLNADSDPDAGLREITELVEEVRREQYERVQQAGAGNR